MKMFTRLALAGCLLMTMTGCALLGGTAGSQDPITVLHETETGFALAEATYDAICSVNSPPGFCADHASYDKAKTAIEALFSSAEAALAVDPTNAASIANLIPQIVADWNAYNQVVNGVARQDAMRRGVPFHPVPLNR